MPVPLPVPEFWKLILESQLLTAEQCQQLGTQWGRIKGAADQSQAKALAEWLVSQKYLSRYQAKILLAGRAGPFAYGDYLVYDRFQDRIQQDAPSGVFRAVHAASRHPVLLHFLTSAQVHDPQVWSAIRQQLSSRNTVEPTCLLTYYEAVDAGTHKFLVSEEVRGETLSERLKRDGRMSITQAAGIAWSIARALGVLHDQGQVHGSLMSDMVRLDSQNAPQLMHSPATFSLPPGFHATPEGLLVAADYWAPELGLGNVATDALTDIYGLGCLLYLMLSGHPPFPGGDLADKLSRHATQAIQPLESCGVPSDLAQLVTYCMAKNRAVRIPHWNAVASQLASYVDPAFSQRLPLSPPPTLAHYIQSLRQVPSSQVPSAPVPAAPAAMARGDVCPKNSVVSTDGSPPASRVVQSPPWPGIPAVTGLPGMEFSQNMSAPVTKRQPHRPRRNSLPTIIASTAVAGFVLSAAVFAIYRAAPNRTTSPEAGAIDDSNRPVANRIDRTSAGNSSGGRVGADHSNADHRQRNQELPPDDGKSLWGAPSDGSPIDLSHVPHGGQLYLHFRPSLIMKLSTGANLIRSLGPRFEQLLREWQQASGFQLAEIERLTGVLFANDGAFPRIAWVVEPAEAIDRERLRESWGNPEETQVADQSYFQGTQWSYYIPTSPNAKIFVMGTDADIRETILLKGAAPVLRTDLRKLLDTSDGERHVTLLGAPNFLFSELFPEGRNFYFGSAQRLRSALEWLLGDELQGVMLSMHFDSQFYWELRLASNPNIDRFRLAADLQKRLEELPDLLLNYTIQLGPNAYWERVRFQFPQMVRFAHKMSRVGVDGDSAMLNGVLPDYAAHNLLFGGELLLASTPGNMVVVPKTTKPTYQSIDEVLTKFQTKIAFAANTLEFSVQDIAKDVNENVRGLPFEFKIKIMGDHLQLDGITRNQTIRNFEQTDKSVAEILTALVLKANPITTVQAPSEPDQKLVWVIADDPSEAGKSMVLITTRQMVEKNKYKLPAVFLSGQ